MKFKKKYLRIICLSSIKMRQSGRFDAAIFIIICKYTHNLREFQRKSEMVELWVVKLVIGELVRG